MTVALPISSSSPIASFLDLRAQIADRLKRTEAEITTPLTMWIALSEAEINRRIAINHVRPSQVIDSITVDGEYVVAPGGLIDIENLYLDGAEVLPTSAQQLAKKRSVETSDAAPQFYALVGNKLSFFPTPDTTYSASVIYWSRVSPLSEDNTSNWVFADHPDVYWFGALAHGFQYYFDEAESQINAGYFSDALDKMVASYPSRPDRVGLASDISPYKLSGWGSAVLV